MSPEFYRRINPELRQRKGVTHLVAYLGGDPEILAPHRMWGKKGEIEMRTIRKVRQLITTGLTTQLEGITEMKARILVLLVSLVLLGSLIPTGSTVTANELGMVQQNTPFGQIAFVSDRDGDLEIYIMSVDGTGLTKLTNNLTNEESPSWSPDGNQIIFHSDRDGYHQLYVMNADGTNESRLITSATWDQWPRWSPRGDKITFARIADHNGDGLVHPEVFVANTDGTNAIRLTYSYGESGGYAHEAWPSGWSPDGSKILFYRYQDQDEQCWIMNVDGSDQHPLTSGTYWNAIPAMSPDGTRIAFASYRDWDFEIYVMNADGTNQTRLTYTPGEDWKPSWSQDGSKLLFESSRDGRKQIYWMNPDGSQQTRLTDNTASDTQACWRPILEGVSTIVSEARLDIGMPYPPSPYNRGCPSDYVGCGGPYHGFYLGVCTDLVMDAYNWGAPFSIQDALSQDHQTHQCRYRWGSARNAEDMRRYFDHNQQLLPNSQAYQSGDIAFFDWPEDGFGSSNHVGVISEVDAGGRPLQMVHATGVYQFNPSGRAFEQTWSSYYDQYIQGHGRLVGTGVSAMAADEMLQVLRISVDSSSVTLRLLDANGKSTSSVYIESLVALNNDAAIPYIPGGTYADLGPERIITVTQPLSNTSQYFVELTGQAAVTYTLRLETWQDSSLTDSEVFTQAITPGETQGSQVTLSAPGGTIVFDATSPVPSPMVEITDAIELSGLVGTSAQTTLTVAEVGGEQSLQNVAVSATNLTDQLGGVISNAQLTIAPDSFTVPAGSSQEVNVQVDLTDVAPGVYQGGLVLTSDNGGTHSIRLTLEVQFYNLYLPVVLCNR